MGYSSEIKKRNRREALAGIESLVVRSPPASPSCGSPGCDALPATPKSTARGRRNAVLAADSGVEPHGEERTGRGGTRHDLLAWKVLRNRKETLVPTIKCWYSSENIEDQF